MIGLYVGVTRLRLGSWSRRQRMAPTVLAVLLAITAGAAEQRSREKQLPAVRILWHWLGDVDSMQAIGDTVFMADRSHVTAVKARDGRLVWEKDYSIGDSDSEGCLKVLDGLLVLSVDDTLVHIDLASGNALQKIKIAGEVFEDFDGLPLVVYAGLKEGNRFISYDIRTGKELARCDPGLKDDEQAIFRLTQGVLVYQASHDPQTLIGLDPATLKELWRRKYETQVCFKMCNGQPGLRLGAPEWEEGFAHFDPRTGQLGPRLPRRALATGSSLRNSRMDWEFDIEDPVQVDEQTLHRYEPSSGELVWSHKLACHSISVQPVRDTVLVSEAGDGREDRWRHHILILDRNSGTLLQQARVPDSFDVIFDFGDFVVVHTCLVGWQAFAFSLQEFDPPETVFRWFEE